MTNKQQRENAIVDAIKTIIGLGIILYGIFTVCAVLDYGWLKGLGISGVVGGMTAAIIWSLWHDAR